MNLSEYLEQACEPIGSFSERTGIPLPTLYKYRTRKRIPGEKAMAKIHEATAGLVTANDFYDLPPAPPNAHTNGKDGNGHG